MKISFKKRFIKELGKIPEQVKLEIAAIVFDKIPQAKDIQELKNIKKIQGFPNFYRLRVSNYRIGIQLKDDRLICCRVLHRKDIYRYFP